MNRSAMTIDLNCDMGESFGNYKIGMDDQVMPHITSANVACGWHAGDPMVMDATVRSAKAHGVGVGAHPGYPDLMGFGRRKMNLTPRRSSTTWFTRSGPSRPFAGPTV